MTAGEKLEVYSEGGATILSHIPKELIGKVIIVNQDTAEKFKPELGNIEEHEQQHVLNNLYNQEPKKHGYHIVNFDQIKAAPTDRQKELILSRMRYQRQFYDNYKISDELLAHYKGHEINTKDEMGKKVIANLVISYRDKIYRGIVSYEMRKLEELGIDRKLIGECGNQIFQDESWHAMREAGNALLEIEQAGFTKNQVISLVQLEPLDQWTKVADSILRYKQSLGEVPAPSY